MNIYTVDDNGVHKGMPVDKMSQAMLLVSRQKPNATIEDIPAGTFYFKDVPDVFLVNPGLTLSHDNAKTPSFLNKQKDLCGVEGLHTVYVKTKHAEQTIFFFPNGEAEIYMGAVHSPSIEQFEEVEKKVKKWLTEGDVGQSSLTMSHFLFGMGDIDPLSYIFPLDGADFKRCADFLTAVPEARERLGEMKNVSKEWDALVEKWSDLETKLQDDINNGGKTLYDEMKSILNKPKRRP